MSASESAARAAEPFKFLDYFVEGDRALFAGRDDEIDDAVAGILRARSFVLYSRSGLGKTSLLRAGVFPRLQGLGYHPIYIRLLQSPLGDLRKAIAPDAAPLDHAGELAADVRRRLAELGAPGATPVALVFDQFEELFIRFDGEPEARRQLAEVLAEALRQPHDLRVIFSLREDYLARLGDFQAELGDLKANSYRLQPLTAFGVREAVVTPLLQKGVAFEERLVTRLVDEAASFGFEPTLLQIACNEAWRAAQARTHSPVVDRMLVEDIRSIGNIFRDYLDDVRQATPAPQRLLLLSVLDALITSEHTKRAVRVSDLLAGDFLATAEELELVLELLQRKRMVRQLRKDDSGTPYYELLHEYLVRHVEEWLQGEEDWQHFRFARGFLAMLSDGRSRASMDLSGEQLDKIVRPWRDRLRLDGNARRLVFRSVVLACSDDVAFWAARYDEACGAGSARALVRELLLGHDERERLAAALAVPHLDDAGQLRLDCVRLALSAREPLAVRKAATAALRGRTTPDELALVREAIGRRASRSNALDVLGWLARDGHRLEGLGWRHARAARRRSFLQRVDEKASAVRERTGIGTLGGSLAGLAWLVAVMPLVTLIFDAIYFDPNDSQVATFEVLIVLCGALFAVLGAWRSSRSSAEAAIAFGDGHARTLRATLTTLPVILLAGASSYLAAGAFSANSGADDYVPGWLLAPFVAIAALVLVRVLLRVTTRACELESDGRWTFIWMAAIFAAFPFSVALALLALLAPPLVWAGLQPLLVCAGAFVMATAVSTSFVGIVVASALYAGWRRAPQGRQTAPVSPRVRGLVRLMVAALPATWIVCLGDNSLPFTARDVSRSTDIDASLSRFWPQTRYYHLRGKGYALVTPDKRAIVVGDGYGGFTGDELEVVRYPLTIAVSNALARKQLDAPPATGHIDLHEQPLADAGALASLAPGELRVVAVPVGGASTVEGKDHRATFKVQLSGKVAGPPGTARVYLRPLAYDNGDGPALALSYRSIPLQRLARGPIGVPTTFDLAFSAGAADVAGDGTWQAELDLVSSSVAVQDTMVIVVVKALAPEEKVK